MSCKKVWIPGFSWKSKDLPFPPPPAPCVLVLTWQASARAGQWPPLWRAHVLSSSSPSPLFPMGASSTPRPPARCIRPVLCACVLWQRTFLCTSGPTESRQKSTRPRESHVLRNGRDCTSREVKTISVCLYANEHVYINNRMHLV